jgi:ferredoxin
MTNKKIKISVNHDRCIGCGLCESLCEECFELKEGKSCSKIDEVEVISPELKEAQESCPVEAISLKKE